jgi:hypothetical protein
MAISREDPVGSLLVHAGQALRELAEPGWDRITDSVIRAVRNTPRSGWPLHAVDPNPTQPPIPGGIEVSDLVLRAVLARALRVDNGYAATAIDISIEGTDLHRICIEITSRYGSRLATVADQVRTTAAAVIDDILGPRGEHHIDVIVTDIVRGNPLHQ